MKKMFLRATTFLTALSCCVFCGCRDEESHEPIVSMAVGLDTAFRVWEKQGKPPMFNPSSAVKSSVERYYNFTNNVDCGGRSYHCLFAVRSELIHTPGTMAIADDGTTLWIYDKIGKVILSPEKNGIERIDH
jgi:hypothetical protein